MVVKENQEQLCQTLEKLFTLEELQLLDCDTYATLDRGHGRVEQRKCWITDDQAYLDFSAEGLTGSTFRA